VTKISTASENSALNQTTEQDNINKTSSLSNDCIEANEVWGKFLKLLSDSLKESEIKTWFSVITPKSFSDNILTITVPSQDYYGIIERRYNNQIGKVIESGILGENGKLKYEVAQQTLFDDHYSEPDKGYPLAGKPAPGTNNILNLKYPFIREYSDTNDPPASPLGTPGRKNSYISLNERDNFNFDSNLHPKHTFENFVKAESNESAVAAAYAITNNPGKIYNPFFVYGGVGIGKTHLIQAIGNEIIKKNPEKKVYYTTTPDFTNIFTTQMAMNKIDFSNNKTGTKKLDSFFRSLDVLILDDIQNLAGRRGTQEFMYQIFNYLFNNNKHIIFSSDKPICQVKDIEERLVSRFQWGITVDIQSPDWEMRVAIIKKKLEQSGVEAPEEVIHYIATNVKDSIRTIEGCIVGMVAESALIYNGEINIEIAERVLQRVIGNVNRARIVSIENIIYTVSAYYNVSENQIRSKRRTKEIAFARQVAMFLSKELTNFTLESIGLNFGGKDHATVLYAHNVIKEAIKKNRTVSLQISEIREKIKSL